MSEIKPSSRLPISRPGSSQPEAAVPAAAPTQPASAPTRDGYVDGTRARELASGAQVQAGPDVTQSLQQIVAQLEALPSESTPGLLIQKRQIYSQLGDLVSQQLRPTQQPRDLGGVVGFRASSQARSRGEALVAQLQGVDGAPDELRAEMRRLINIHLALDRARTHGAAPGTGAGAGAPAQPAAGPRADAAKVSFDPSSGALLLDGQQPSDWSTAGRALAALAAASRPSGENPLSGLPLEQRAALLETARRAADRSLFAAGEGGQLSDAQAAQLRRSSARVMNALAASGLAEASPEGRSLARDALSAARDLALAEPAGVLKRDMAGDLYAHLPQLPDELKEIPRPLMREYVPVWAFESDPEGPGGIQPIPIAHFDTDGEGRVGGLRGPRVRVDMPDEIAVKMDDFGLKPEEFAPSPLPREVTPGDDGFLVDPQRPEAGATTAFYATTQVIDSADRWAGHPVGWGQEGKLPVKPYMFVTNFFNAFYDGKERALKLGTLGELTDEGIKGFSGTPAGFKKPVEDLVLDGSRSRDIVAHEAGHAALAGVKPGLSYGCSMALNEAIADTTSCFTALDDPDVVARVLAETGGDLRQPNEATRMAEVIGAAVHRYRDDDPSNDELRYLRSMHSPLTLEDLDLSRDEADLPGMGISPSRDPHLVGGVISGGLYDLFASLYEQGVAEGQAPEDAIAQAKDVTGTLAFRATRHIGEHMISFHDYAKALMETDQEVYGGRHQALLRSVLEKRKLLEPGEDVATAMRARREALPELTLPPDVKDPAEVMRRLEAFEAQQVAAARTAETREEKERVVLLRHNRYVPDLEKIKAEDLKLFRDDTSEDGVRVIRLHYMIAGMDPYAAGGGEPVNAYKSLVFDRAGKLIDVHVDEPRSSSF